MYLNRKDLEDYWVLDIETDSLTPTVIWCCVVRNLKTGEVLVFTKKEEFLEWYKVSYILVGHNIISFDAPVLNSLWDGAIDLGSCCDTLVLSYLYNPGIKGGHSLDVWGQRLGYPKIEFNDFSTLTDEMITYCKGDVELTYRLFIAITDKMRRLGYSELSCQIEHKIRVIIDQQQTNGFWFDSERAKDFRDFLQREQSHLSKIITDLFPPRRTKVAEYTLRRTKDGRPHSSYERHRAKYPEIIVSKDGSSYECYDYVAFNLGSPKQRIERLLELGWEPTEFTPKGNPKVDEDALLAFAEASGRRELKALAEWLVIQGRLTMLAGNPSTGSLGWLGNVGPDSRIHGRVLSCGATTRRMIHSNPNTANIPSGAKAKYGHECRSFWGVQPKRGFRLVGYDASGLETAGLCHYLNNPDATQVLLQAKPNDIHSVNARRLTEALGRPIDREWGAKTTWYAWLYGAYPKKLGQIVKGPPKDGDIVIDTFFRNVPGLKELINGVQREWTTSSGRLATIDGGFVICPSLNATLNYKIQSLGAILMKLTSIILDEEARSRGVPFLKVGDIHDEGQLETEEKYADELGKLAVWSIEEAGRRLKLNVPVTGSYSIGSTWAETH